MAHIISLLNSAELGFLFRETEGDSKEQPPWAPCFKSWVQGHLNKGCKRVYKASQQIWFSPYWVLKKCICCQHGKIGKLNTNIRLLAFFEKRDAANQSPYFQVVIPGPEPSAKWSSLALCGSVCEPIYQSGVCRVCQLHKIN